MLIINYSHYTGSRIYALFYSALLYVDCTASLQYPSIFYLKMSALIVYSLFSSLFAISIIVSLYILNFYIALYNKINHANPNCLFMNPYSILFIIRYSLYFLVLQ